MLVTFLVFAAVFLIVLALVIIYLYPGGSKTTTIPGLDPSDPKDGNLADIGKAGSLHEFLTNLHNDHGDIVSFWMGQEMVVSIASPQLFKEMSHVFDRPASLYMLFEPMITPHSIQYANSAEGRKRRFIYDKSFSHQAMTPCYEIFEKNTEELVQKLKDMADNEHIPLMQYSNALTIKNMAMAAYGWFFADEKEILKLGHNFDVCWSEMESRVSGSTPDPDSQRIKTFNKCEEDMKSVIRAAIEHRRENGAKPGEYLFIDSLLESGFSDDVIYADFITYLFGGFHSTGLGLTWGIYFLATHQDIQDKVVEEIKAVLGNKAVSPDTYEDLRYLRQVVNETFRCSILAPSSARFQEKEVEIAGHKIPAMTPVIMALGVVLHDETLYPEPYTFDPDRFEEDAMKALPSFAFEPFGFAGKRKCPGYRFGYLEITICLVTLLRNFKFDLVEGQVVIPEYRILTKPKDEIWVTVSKRK